MFNYVVENCAAAGDEKVGSRAYATHAGKEMADEERKCEKFK